MVKALHVQSTQKTAVFAKNSWLFAIRKGQNAGGTQLIKKTPPVPVEILNPV